MPAGQPNAEFQVTQDFGWRSFGWAGLGVEQVWVWSRFECGAGLGVEQALGGAALQRCEKCSEISEGFGL